MAYSSTVLYLLLFLFLHSIPLALGPPKKNMRLDPNRFWWCRTLSSLGSLLFVLARRFHCNFNPRCSSSILFLLFNQQHWTVNFLDDDSSPSLSHSAFTAILTSTLTSIFCHSRVPYRLHHPSSQLCYHMILSNMHSRQPVILALTFTAILTYSMIFNYFSLLCPIRNLALSLSIRS